jgi:hypothetical protein
MRAINIFMKQRYCKYYIEDIKLDVPVDTKTSAFLFHKREFKQFLSWVVHSPPFTLPLLPVTETTKLQWVLTTAVISTLF